MIGTQDKVSVMNISKLIGVDASSQLTNIRNVLYGLEAAAEGLDAVIKTHTELFHEDDIGTINKGNDDYRKTILSLLDSLSELSPDIPTPKRYVLATTISSGMFDALSKLHVLCNVTMADSVYKTAYERTCDEADAREFKNEFMRQAKITTLIHTTKIWKTMVVDRYLSQYIISGTV